MLAAIWSVEPVNEEALFEHLRDALAGRLRRRAFRQQGRELITAEAREDVTLA